MSDNSAIEWTDATWNPVTGCTQIPGVKGAPSGCDHCYAKRLNDTRMIANPKSVRFGVPFEVVMTHPERLTVPSRWRRPRRIFVNSLSDLFHVDVADGFIEEVFREMDAAPQHTYQILTKRPQRIGRWMAKYRPNGFPLGSKILVGTSISSNADAPRSEIMNELGMEYGGLDTFLSVEPLCAPVDRITITAGTSWVIVGGESGPGWRPMDFDWAREVRDRCARNFVPFFFKQVAAQRPNDEMIPADLRIRQYPFSVPA